VYCPICEKGFLKFLRYGGRQNAMCPNCGSLERHRLIYLFLKNETNFKKPSKRILHFAPEYSIQNKLKKIHGENYTSADIEHPSAKLNFDITKIPFKKDTFDLVICSHVIQEVKYDKKAISEIFRVLKKKGVAIILCPVDEKRKRTYENKNAKTSKERAAEFGYYGAIRVYGKDFVKKLESPGFNVNTADYSKIFSNEKFKRYGLCREKIYICTK